MKQILNFAFVSVFFCLNSYAQQGTEVYVTDLNRPNDSLKIGTPINISNNEGYDNQPSFFSNDKILFASTRNNQTDIALYDVRDKTTTWLSNTPNGSEYSPLKIPEKVAISAVRLDEDGLQRLYEYNIKTGESKILIPDLKVGYHVWYTKDIIVCTVLIENRMDLVVYNLKENTHFTAQKNVGRSLHKIPNTELISFIAKRGQNAIVKSLNPNSKEAKDIINLLGDSEDISWMNDGRLINAYESIILSFDPKVDTEWKLAYEINDPDVNGISRLAISPKGKYLSFVSKDSQKSIVNKQVETFNARDVKAFANCFSKNVVVKNYPRDTLYVGREILKEKYQNFYDRTPNIDVKVSSRIHLGKTIIDKEQITIGDRQFHQVAIYEVDGLINSMTFLKDTSIDKNPEVPVQYQLEAYNAKDINAFLSSYAKDVKVYGANGELRTEGIENMRNDYDRFFSTTTDLHCETKNRIVIGNIVIDEEFITIKGDSYTAIGIYEIENNKIAKVTFLH
ncbi:nuclear transport factor 2 family protein [Maribacter sp. R86514]|uniref:nuclear transport factor 2 family protein n=1 Tax=Maribacter sp. R86514 TaxID=3093854 RepID=UPI0037C815DD